MERNDYYVLLGVKRSASRADIRRAFQKLARKYHPDINPGDSVAAVRYQRIYEAFEVLSDAGERKKYDEGGGRPPQLEQPQEPSRYGFEGFDFSLEERRDTHIFSDLFEPPRAKDAEQELNGEDIHHRLTISFEESLEGLEASFQISPSLSCETCEGWGEIPSAQPRRCSHCHGRGGATQARGYMLFSKRCPHCHGTGAVSRERCPACAGDGRRPQSRSVNVDIPAGVADGDRLSFPGMGHQGRGSGRSGDLYLHVHVLDHPFFSRKGDNLYCTVPITFAEAALGTRVDVPTPDGSVKLRIPAGVQSGQKLRLSERGAPARRGPLRGDLFVTMQVVTPAVYDDKSRELLRELERLNPQELRKDLRAGAGGKTSNASSERSAEATR